MPVGSILRAIEGRGGVHKADSRIVYLLSREGCNVYLERFYKGRRRWQRCSGAQSDQKQGHFAVSIQVEQGIDRCISKAERQMHWQGARIGGSQEVGEYCPGVPKTVAVSPGPIFPGVAPEGVTANQNHRGFLQRWTVTTGLHYDAPIVPLT